MNKELTLEEKIKMFPVICYSRIVGWLVPTKNFNLGKKSEREDRVNFIIKDIK